MASKRMCTQSVMLCNYVGEVDGVATYNKTYLHNVKCIIYHGVSTSKQGRGDNDTSKLYIFDDILFAANEAGEEVQYLPYEEWLRLSDKSGYWTLNPNGDDFYYDVNENKDTISGETEAGTAFAGQGLSYFSNITKFRIVGFKRLDQGSRRLVHFEVDGE